MRLQDTPQVPMLWLWHPYIPIGCVSLMFGPGGVGKSHIVCDLASRISRGRPFPLSAPEKRKRKPGNVLIMSAEDDPAQVLRPRLRAAGADMKRIFYPEEEFILDKQGLRDLEAIIEECSPTAVFLDPIVALMGGKIDMFRANQVRGLVQPLNKIAQRQQVAMMVVHHQRKNKGGSIQDNAMGSADFTNGPRSSLYIVRDKYGTALWHAKTNYAKKGPAISFSFNPEVDCIEWGEEREDEEPQLGWNGGGGGGQGGGGRASKADAAIAFLRTLLKDGPVASKEVDLRAQDQSFCKRTLDRAKESIAQSFAKRIGGKQVWYWRLIGGSQE